MLVLLDFASQFVPQTSPSAIFCGLFVSGQDGMPENQLTYHKTSAILTAYRWFVNLNNRHM
jgi:hypothetical protein